jgi:hypothetical protein
VIDISTIAYSENDDIGAYKGINHPVITNTILAKTSELPFEHRVRLRFPGELMLDLINHAAGLRS